MDALRRVGDRLSRRTRATLMVRGFGLFKIPMIFVASPRVVEISDERCSIRIPLNRMTRNHMKSMYLAVLVLGADVAAGLMAMEAVVDAGVSVGPAFKDLRAEFLRRADGDVLFTCEQGQEARAAVARVIETGERQNIPIRVSASVESLGSVTEVARFELTLSLK